MHEPGERAVVVLILILIIFVFVAVLLVFIVRHIDERKLENRSGKFLAEQIAFFADPDAFNRVVGDVRDSQGLSSGFENNNVACFQCHGRLLADVRSCRLAAGHDTPTKTGWWDCDTTKKPRTMSGAFEVQCCFSF